MGQGVAGGADHAEDVDVQDPAPLLVVVVLDGADGADPGVGDEGVQAAQFRGGPLDARADGRVVAHVGLDRQRPVRDARRLPVEHGDACAAGQQKARHGGSYARGTARHEGGQSVEVLCTGHRSVSSGVRRACQTGPCG